MFAAAKNRVKYYLSERDPVALGGPTNFNPFTNTVNSAAALRSNPVGVALRLPADVPVGPGRHARGRQLGAGHRHQRRRRAAEHHRGGARGQRGGRRQHDPRRLRDRQPQLHRAQRRRPLAAAKAAVADDPATPDVNESAPAVPAGTCTVNVGFKPTRTNYTSVARLQFTANGDDATERVLLAAKSTGDAIGTVGGNVPSMLALSLPDPARQLRHLRAHRGPQLRDRRRGDGHQHRR